VGGQCASVKWQPLNAWPTTTNNGFAVQSFGRAARVEDTGGQFA
jgi:hypothetical protein